MLGNRAKAPPKRFEINYGALTRIARHVRGSTGGGVQNPYLSGIRRRSRACLPCPQDCNGEIYLVRRRRRKNQPPGPGTKLQAPQASGHLGSSWPRAPNVMPACCPFFQDLGGFQGWRVFLSISRAQDRRIWRVRSVGTNTHRVGSRANITAPTPGRRKTRFLHSLEWGGAARPSTG